MKEYKRYLVTSALPYANGPVHIGHLAGVYIPSDIYVRYLRLKGKDVISVCGSDEHGVPITLKAKKENKSPQEVVDYYHNIIKNSFEEFGIEFDVYSRTSSKLHYETASEMFKTIHEKGGFTEQTTEQYYDTEAQQFLADRYITGECPHCANKKAYGDQCEQCGTSLNATDLINPKSTISGSELVLKSTKHWFLPLNNHEEFLRKWILEEHKEWKSNVYGQCKSWIELGLQPRAVSRDLDWGVPVPLDNADGKVLYVWFDAPIGYISATKELTPDWEKYWKSDDTKMVHFIGKDNIVFHCIIFPAMLRAEGSYILPENVPANEFLNLENDKISTSRNWAVWLHEYLQDFKNQQDALRYVLIANAPENKDSDFTWKDFQTRNNNELLAVLGNFVNRTLVLTNKYYGGVVPECSELTTEEQEVLNEIPKLKQKVEKAIENFKFREALKEAMNVARLGNKFLTETEPWKLIKTEPEKVKNIISVALDITAALSIILEPFLPFSTKKIRDFLNIEKLDWEDLNNTRFLSHGHKINKSSLLFRKIEDEEVEYQVNKLLKSKAENLEEIKHKELKEQIVYDDFAKLDIRTGVILEAKKVKKAKKLLELLVDTGIDKRTLVAGIAEFYKPEEIIGKKVSVLLNLKARKIRGIQSNGMILMAENNKGELAFVEPSKDFEPGAILG